MTHVRPTELTNEKETMLITLYGRAMQSRSARPILPDPWAEAAVDRLEYDFAKFKVGRRGSSLFALRAGQLDAWAREFLTGHAEATVLHLGCGLDSRAFRVAPGPGVRWFDVDYPEVIALRRSLYPETPGYRMIGTSLAELDWLREIPDDRPVLVVAEGVTMYLTGEIVQALLNTIVDRFPSGEIAFDVHPPQLVEWMAKRKGGLRGTGATFHWGLDDPRDLHALEPRLELMNVRRATRLPGYNRLAWDIRVLLHLMNAIPALRIMRCLRYRFGQANLAA